MAAQPRHKVMVGIGGTIATGGAAVGAAIGGPLGMLAGLAIAALGSAIASYGAYWMQPPREVWSDEKRRKYRSARIRTAQQQSIQEYDDESPIPVKPKPER